MEIYAGLRVFATARDKAALKDLEELGIETLSFDVTAQADRVRVREELERVAGGRLDVLVNNALVPPPPPSLYTFFTLHGGLILTHEIGERVSYIPSRCST